MGPIPRRKAKWVAFALTGLFLFATGQLLFRGRAQPAAQFVNPLTRYDPGPVSVNQTSTLSASTPVNDANKSSPPRDTVTQELAKKPRRPARVALVTGTDYAAQAGHWSPSAIPAAIEERKRYAERHGYTFDLIDLGDFQQDMVDPRLSRVWLKVPVLKYIMKKRPEADWIWWLDIDAVLMDESLDLQTVLFDSLDALQDEARAIQNRQPVNKNSTNVPNEGVFEYVVSKVSLDDTNLIIAPDMNNRMFNAGSFLVRPSLWAEMLLDSCVDPLFVGLAMKDKIKYAEQGTLTHLILRHQSIREHTAVVPMRLINAFAWAPADYMYQPGSLVMHAAGCWTDKSCDYYDEMYRKVKNGTLQAVVGYVPPAEDELEDEDETESQSPQSVLQQTQSQQ